MLRYSVFCVLTATILLATGNHAAAQQPACTYNQGTRFEAVREYGKAFACWQPLARTGNAKAQYAIGLLYARGRGVPLNLTEALKWFLIAERHGLPEAKVAIDTVGKKLSPAQIGDARERSRQWLATYR